MSRARVASSRRAEAEDEARVSRSKLLLLGWQEEAHVGRGEVVVNHLFAMGFKILCLDGALRNALHDHHVSVLIMFLKTSRLCKRGLFSSIHKDMREKKSS